MKAQASARLDVPAAPPFFALRTKESNTCVQFFHENAWICARPTTDRDLEKSQRHEKVNLWICARPTTHDLVSIIPDNEEQKKEEEKGNGKGKEKENEKEKERKRERERK